MAHLSKLLTLTFLLLTSAATALAGAPPMPRVLHALPYPAPADGSVSAHHLQVNGRTVAYVLGEVNCPPPGDVCTSEYTVSEYDGVDRREIFTTGTFILSAKLSADQLVWQPSPSSGTDYPLWAADRGGAARLLTGDAVLDAYDVSGKRVVWTERDDDAFITEIVLDGKVVTTPAEPQPAPFGLPPVISNNSFVFQVDHPTEEAYVLAKRGSKKFRPLPSFLPDQTIVPFGLEVGRKGDKVLLLKRDFIAPAEHHELSIYDVSSKRTTTIALEYAPIQGFDYDGGRYFAWLRGSDMGPTLQITDVDTGETDEALAGVDAAVGNLADGLLSFVIPFEGPRLYDVETGQTETIAFSGGENGVASSGRNVAWETYDASFTSLTLNVSYPADEAVSAIVDVVKGYGLPGAQKQRLLKPLSTALRALGRSNFDAALQAMYAFVGAIDPDALGTERAAALTNAGQLVVMALSF